MLQYRCVLLGMLCALSMGHPDKRPEPKGPPVYVPRPPIPVAYQPGPPNYSEPPKGYGLKPNIKDDPYHNEPVSYQYGFKVEDDYEGTKFSKQENRDGYELIGEYVVDLPDTRRQIVRYRAHPELGFVADVQYEGTPVYPPDPPPKKEKPVYKPVYEEPRYAPRPAVQYQPAADTPQVYYAAVPRYQRSEQVRTYNA